MSTRIIQAEITVTGLSIQLYGSMDPTQSLELSPGIEVIVWASLVTSRKLVLSHGKQWYLKFFRNLIVMGARHPALEPTEQLHTL